MTMIKPVYPSRRETILGMKAFKAGNLGTISQAFISSTLCLKYTCTLTRGAMMVSAVIVSHLELSDYCDLKGFELFTLDKPVELALSNERSSFG